MNGQFDLVVSETHSAALRELSLIGRCQDLTDRKRYLDPPVIFWSSRRMAGKSIRFRNRHIEVQFLPPQPGSQST